MHQRNNMFSTMHLVAVICIFCLGQGIAVPVDQMSLSVQPPSFRPGQTTAVVINCTFFKARGSDLVSVSSLKLVDPNTLDALIAEINVFSVPLAASAVGQTQVTATGDINGVTGAYLTTTWHNPALSHGVTFKCVAEGVGSNGQAVRLTKTATASLSGTAGLPITAAPTQAPTIGPFTPVAFSTNSPSQHQVSIASLQAIILQQSTIIQNLQARCGTPAPVTAAPWRPITAAPITNAPWTYPPVTNSPWTLPPVTAAPITNAPWTYPPVTNAPWTFPPVTAAPITNAPWTYPPVTNAPWTNPPVTAAPITNAPWTYPPITNAPWTNPPVTAAPITNAPWTYPPVTNAPWTNPPVTQRPFTFAPVTQRPFTFAPVTQRPVTFAPVTLAPFQLSVSQTSSTYLSHRYLLTTAARSDIDQGQAYCVSQGGYLAEITDQNEDNHVTGFLASIASSLSARDQVFLGMTYSDFTKTYYYMKSGNPITYHDWDQKSQQPHNEAGRNCVVIIPENNLKMSATVCVSEYPRRYLCEIP